MKRVPWPRPPVGRAISPRTAFWCACCSWALTLTVTVTALIYTAVRPLPGSLVNQQGSGADGVAGIAFVTGFATVGALLVWKRPGNPIGWLLSVTGLSYAAGISEVLLAHFPGALTFVSWMGWIWLFGIGLAVFVLLLFPTGHLPSRRWRPVAWAAAAGIAGWVLGNSFAPRIISDDTPTPNPVGVAAPAGDVFVVLAIGGVLLIVGTGLAALVSLVFRYRRAATVEREQLKWLVYAGALIVLALLAELVAEHFMGPTNAANNLQNALSSGGVALVPMRHRYRHLPVPPVRHRRRDQQDPGLRVAGGVHHRVYVAIVVGIGVAGAARRTSRASGLSIAATAVVAVAFQPVRARVQHLANRLVYGKRATPYEVLADFAGRMAGAYAAEDLLPRMARILAEGTGAARADVWLTERRGRSTTAPPGRRRGPFRCRRPGHRGRRPAYPAADRVLPVRYQGEVLGALSVTKRPGEVAHAGRGQAAGRPRRPGRPGAQERRAAGAAAARLEEIRASRQRLVAAQDEERRRIERNIHDGAQQQLVAMAIKLSITECLIGTDTDGERELLAELRQEAAGAVEDLRDLARGIYPPLLASQGLAAALQAQAAKVAGAHLGGRRRRRPVPAGRGGRRVFLRPGGPAERRQVRGRQPGPRSGSRLRGPAAVRGDRRRRGLRPGRQRTTAPACRAWRTGCTPTAAARRAVRARRRHTVITGGSAAGCSEAAGVTRSPDRCCWPRGLFAATVAALAVSAELRYRRARWWTRSRSRPCCWRSLVWCLVAEPPARQPDRLAVPGRGLVDARLGVADRLTPEYATQAGAASPAARLGWPGPVRSPASRAIVPPGPAGCSRTAGCRPRAGGWWPGSSTAEALLVILAATSGAALRAQNSVIQASPGSADPGRSGRPSAQ